MKTISFLVMSVLIGTSTQSMAGQAVIVPINKRQLVLGYGAGKFPSGTIKSPNGKFQLVLPQSFNFRNFKFAENFDSQCAISPVSSFAPYSLILTIDPSSAESSRCVLNYQISNGEVGQIIGIFSSGE